MGYIYHDEPTPFEVQKVESTLQQYCQDTERLRIEVESACNILPKVGKDGNSDCTFAESLYRKKDKLASDLEYRVPYLRNYARLTLDEKELRHRDRKIIEASEQGITLPGPKLDHHYALEEQLKRCDKIDELYKMVTTLLADIAETLAEAKKKRWPLDDQEQSSKSHSPTSAATSRKSPRDSFSAQTRDDTRNPIPSGGDLEGLISMGPKE